MRDVDLAQEAKAQWQAHGYHPIPFRGQVNLRFIDTLEVVPSDSLLINEAVCFERIGREYGSSSKQISRTGQE